MFENEGNLSESDLIRNLTLSANEARDKIRSLESELFDARKNARAWENLFDLLNEEKKEAKEIITMHENLGNLVKIEKKESKHAIEALIEHQKISQTEIHQKALTLKNILQINKEITGVPNGDVLLNKILVSIIHVLGFERGVLMMLKDRKLVRETSFNLTDEELGDSIFVENQKIITETVQSHKTRIQVFNNYSYKNDIAEMYIVASPLIIQKTVVGVVYFDSTFINQVLKELDIDTVEIFSSQLALAIESNALYEKLEMEFQNKTLELNQANERLHAILKNIKSDMQLAKKIQEKLLPERKDYPDINFSIYYELLFEIGGDIYDIIKVRDGYYRIFLGDATGHGIQAALTTSLIKGEYDKIRNENVNPADLLRKLNRSFMAQYKSLNVFFSAIILDINLNTKKITFSSAGHPPQFLLFQGKSVSMEKKGKIIGLLEDVRYGYETLEYLGDAKLFLFTDGLFEEFNEDKDMFGEERILEILTANSDKSAEYLIRNCLSELKKFTGYSSRLEDDITVIGAEFR
jgi:serine phosphatase RsbU (regulator of sigma subunit)